ncbi:MAG TPA: glycoside hydrolase family 15 protein [Actinomycetota bacterium]|jgi:GH15 family glucan-1,4-alpha-glucosidase|nr:glycoside hydrolase family 15 protein [Actinomycetota bacterium]
MAAPIEDYALIGDTHTAGLVSRDGSIDWLCLPRFDSPACFAALLGDRSNGRWLLAPAGGVQEVRRRYQGDSLVLETEYRTDDGVVRVIDCMPPRHRDPDVARVVEGIKGRVRMRMDLTIRFDYGSIVPWVRREGGALHAVAGPDSVWLRTPVPVWGENWTTLADFTVAEGERAPFMLTWHASHRPAPRRIDPVQALGDTEAWWGEWASGIDYQGGWQDAVIRSLLTLKALTYAPTGGIVAAPTTSLPEQLGGVRNWDYRYCWLRDSTFTLSALMLAGLADEAKAWREWLLRAVAGQPQQMQILYGVAGERRITEQELDWLSGYQGSRPVRIGNAAVNQFQLDVYGEVMDTLHVGRYIGLESDEAAWDLQQALLEFLESNWRQPDEGIWEIRGPRRHFTHSKVMAWVALDRAIKAVELLGHEGPVDRWRAVRRELHDEVCREGYDSGRDSFVQFYGADHLDASLLQIPLVGFLPADDPRVKGTVAAIQRELVVDGLVHRYPPQASQSVDGLPPGEGTFLACTFWLADNLALMDRREEAVAIYERLLTLRNDVGLLAEEYDPASRRLLGNFPQAFSHVALVNSANYLSEGAMPAWARHTPSGRAGPRRGRTGRAG